MSKLGTRHYGPDALQQISLNPKKVKILENYLELCSEETVSGVTLQKVADKSGISLGNVHYHFGGKGKPDLETSAIRYVSQESIKLFNVLLQEKVQDQGLGPIEAYIDVIFSWSKERRTHAQFFLYYYYVSITEKENYRSLNEEYVGLMRSRLEFLVNLGIEQGRYGKDIDVKELAPAIHGLVMGQMVLSYYDPRKDAFEYYKDVCFKAAKKLLS